MRNRFRRSKGIPKLSAGYGQQGGCRRRGLRADQARRAPSRADGLQARVQKAGLHAEGQSRAEIDAVADAIPVDCIIVAPAYPKIGRTTRNGIHYVNDVRIDRTETAKDPKSPVAEADLVKLLASQSQRQAGLLPLEALRAARKPLACESGSCFGAASKSSYATPSRTRICGESPTSRRQAWDECYGQARPVSRNACRIRSRWREAAERTSTCRASSP